MDSHNYNNQSYDPQQNNQQYGQQSHDQPQNVHPQFEQPQYYNQQPYEPWQYGQPPYDPYFSPNANPAPTSSGMSIASLVLGILATIFGCCYGAGFIFGIIGLILGIVGNKNQKNGMGIAGIVLSTIGLVLAVLFWLLIIVSLFYAGFDSFNYYL